MVPQNPSTVLGRWWSYEAGAVLCRDGCPHWARMVRDVAGPVPGALTLQCEISLRFEEAPTRPLPDFKLVDAQESSVALPKVAPHLLKSGLLRTGGSNKCK